MSKKEVNRVDGYNRRDFLKQGVTTGFGATPDMDVYDAAAWSVINDLTERSVAHKSKDVKFPDFTRGSWKRRPRVKIMGV